jgi:hypothetical protein
MAGERCKPIDGPINVEHVRDPHPVWGAVDGATGRIEVSMPIDIDETQPLTPLPQASHGADTDGAVTPRTTIVSPAGEDRPARRPGQQDQSPPPHSPLPDCRGPAATRRRHLPTAAHRHTSRLQLLDQARLEQRPGTVLLTGRAAPLRSSEPL